MAINRRNFLAGTAALALPASARAQAKPRLTFISQWSAGSDGAAISGLGKRLEEEGGVWQHSPVPGFTTEMMNKLRADIIAGNPPAASQLKGPEIAAWSKIAPTVNLDSVVAAAGYEKLIPAELVGLHKPQGHWIALPIQVYRINTMFLSRLAMEKVGATKPPTTWAEFNELATKMKAAGITPVANGGIRWDDGMKLEIVLAGISADVYRGGADAARLQGAAQSRNARRVHAAAQGRRLDGPDHRRPALFGAPAEVHEGRDGRDLHGRMGAGRDQGARPQARGHRDRAGAAGRRQAVLRAQRGLHDLLAAQRTPTCRPASSWSPS